MVSGNSALQSFYSELNKIYWNDQLPHPMVLRFKKMSSKEGHTIFMTSGTVKVYVHEAFKSHLDSAQIILLHEMIHVGLGFEYKGDHGMRFEAEKVRLFMAGAYDKLL
jgi:hypothetical protein